MSADSSYFFESGAWRGQLSGWTTNGPTPSNPISGTLNAAVQFTMWATNMAVTPMNPNATGNYGNSPLAVVGDFYTFMEAYNNWAANDFKGNPQAINHAATAINNITQDMAK